MRSSRLRYGMACFAACLAAAPCSATAQSDGQDTTRRALIAALESLLGTGEPRHTTHDEGERLQLAVDEALARGDREIETLAIRAASPLTASISRPVSSTRELPAITLDASNVLRLARAVPYTARVSASVDHGEFVAARVIASGKTGGGGIDAILPDLAARPGFHVVQLKADLTFGAKESGAASWTESRTLPPLSYALYDPVAESSASIRALIYRPASTAVRDLDPALGDEPFAAWLSGVLSTRRTDRDSAPDWLSQYCHERIGEPGSKLAPTAICSVVYFQSRGEIGQIWFRTADLRETELGIECVPALPPRFEGMVLRQSAQQDRLSALPSLLDASPESRPVGDTSITPADIVISPSDPKPGAFADVTVTVRNVGEGDLHKTVVHVGFGVDPMARGTSRQFVVDIPAHGSAELKLQVAFPNGYGFVMANAMQLSEHSPFDNWTPDPTPDDACAFRVVNAKIAPPKYTQALFEAAAGCRGE